jgi:DNA polymerase-3 subunit gamma/tau
MSYQPLATKYRPETFADLVGQEAVAKALAGAISLDRLHHSIIFSGVRGIGKTTIARLLAKALNCEIGPTPFPCGRCDSCIAITHGNHEDVLEIDGASNTGVDDVRALKEAVSYVSQRSKYKIYIIDEVHMLSTSAFNALLKTLEEPPPDVVFIFATTELQKIPATVIGRCLTFTLKKMTVETIAKRVEHILNLEKIPYEPRAIQVVAREGNGSMRDALTFLDQVIAMGNGEVRYADLDGLVSSTSSATVLNLLFAMLGRHGKKCIEIIDNLDQLGARFATVVDEAAKFARHVFILRDLGKDALNVTQLGLTDDELLQLSEIAAAASPLDANRIFRTLVQCRSELDGSDLDRFIFENFVLEWCFDPGMPEIATLLREQPANLNISPSAVVRPIAPKIQSEVLTSPNTERPKSFITKDFLQEMKQDVSPPVPGPSLLKQDVVAPISRANDTSAPEKLTVIAGASGASDLIFPPSWRELVDIWKQAKPLQARKLEEVHPIHYSREKIIVAVDPNGMIGPLLLQLPTQKSIEKMFNEMFGFTGQFTAIEKDRAHLAAAGASPLPNLATPIVEMPVARTVSAVLDRKFVEENAPGPAEKALPMSILENRAKEKTDRRSSLLDYAREHEMTRGLLSEFDGKIVDIRITDPTAAD